jgi:hypothetical protein
VRRAAAIALAAAAWALAAPAAQAARGMEVGIQDDPVFLQRDYYDRDLALEQARQLGVTRIRVNLGWASVLGADAKSETETPPPGYGAFALHDDLISAAAARGIRVQITIIPPAPAFATSNGKVGVQEPNPRMFGRFVRAVAEHFRGRVDRYSIWNEPNHVGWLAPQKRAPALYRELYRAGYAAVKRVDRSAEVLLGELLPYENLPRQASPLRFLRELTCTKPTAAFPGARTYRLHRTGGCPVLRADGLAHHPYDYQGPPERPYPGTDNVTIGTLSRLTTTLDALARVRALATPKRRTVPVYLTEFGYFGTGKYSHPDVRRASYLKRAYALALRNTAVREITQYLLVRPPRRYRGGYFDMALIDSDGAVMDSFRALSKWSRKAAARGDIAAPGDPIALPPQPIP